MKKVKFIVLVGGFMMASGSLHASDGAGAGIGEGDQDRVVDVDQETAKALGLRLIKIIQMSKPGDNLEEQVRQLLADGADVNAKDKLGYTALILASLHDRANIVEILLGRGADVNAKDELGYTALMQAAQRGHIEIVEILLGRGADVNVQNEYGYTALMQAVNNGHAEIVKNLLDHGADVNAQDKIGYTALMGAAQDGRHIEIIEILLDRGADVDAQNQSGYTALTLTMSALTRGANNNVQRAQAVKLLFKYQTGEENDTINAMITQLQDPAAGRYETQRVINSLIEYIVTHSHHDNAITYLIFILRIWNNSDFIKHLLRTFIGMNQELSKAYKDDVDNIVNGILQPAVLLQKLIKLQESLKELGIGLK